MEARRVDRDTAKSVAGIARHRAFPEQIDLRRADHADSLRQLRGRCLAVSVIASYKHSFDLVGLFTAAVLIIFALLWTMAGESSLCLSMHRERVC